MKLYVWICALLVLPFLKAHGAWREDSVIKACGERIAVVNSVYTDNEREQNLFYKMAKTEICNQVHQKGYRYYDNLIKALDALEMEETSFSDASSTCTRLMHDSGASYSCD